MKSATTRKNNISRVMKLLHKFQNITFIESNKFILTKTNSNVIRLMDAH